MIDLGSVVLADLDPTVGHEERGLRPYVVVSDAEAVSSQRYPLIALVPLSGREGEGALYPPVDTGGSGLRQRSWALVDQVRSVDKRRVVRLVGRVDDVELAAIDEGLQLFLGLVP